jgi:transposase
MSDSDSETHDLARLWKNLWKWLIHQRFTLTAGTRTAGAIDYSRKRWDALRRYLADREVPIDSNWIDSQVRSRGLGRKN